MLQECQLKVQYYLWLWLQAQVVYYGSMVLLYVLICMISGEEKQPKKLSWGMLKKSWVVQYVCVEVTVFVSVHACDGRRQHSAVRHRLDTTLIAACLSFLPFSLLGSCYSSGWSPFPKSQIPPHTLGRPAWSTVWCAPPVVSNSPPCPPSRLLPFHYPPSVQAAGETTHCIHYWHPSVCFSEATGVPKSG